MLYAHCTAISLGVKRKSLTRKFPHFHENNEIVVEGTFLVEIRGIKCYFSILFVNYGTTSTTRQGPALKREKQAQATFFNSGYSREVEPRQWLKQVKGADGKKEYYYNYKRV